MLINRTVALEHVDGDSRLLADLASIFIEDCPRLIGEVHRCMEKGDSAALERAAHSLKGRLAFFGMERERELALKLEMSGRQAELSDAGCLLAELEGAIETAMPEFETLADNAC